MKDIENLCQTSLTYKLMAQEYTKGKTACLREYCFPWLEIFVSTTDDTHLRVRGAVTMQPLVATNTFQPVCGLGRRVVLLSTH
jgi:hypothetical protein